VYDSIELLGGGEMILVTIGKDVVEETAELDAVDVVVRLEDEFDEGGA
jgi:hypothetical protein